MDTTFISRTGALDGRTGFRWEKIREGRRECFIDFKNSIDQIFKTCYEKITGGPISVPASPIHILPTMKTPSCSRLKIPISENCSWKSPISSADNLPADPEVVLENLSTASRNSNDSFPAKPEGILENISVANGNSNDGLPAKSAGVLENVSFANRHSDDSLPAKSAGVLENVSVANENSNDSFPAKPEGVLENVSVSNGNSDDSLLAKSADVLENVSVANKNSNDNFPADQEIILENVSVINGSCNDNLPAKPEGVLENCSRKSQISTSNLSAKNCSMSHRQSVRLSQKRKRCVTPTQPETMDAKKIKTQDLEEDSQPSDQVISSPHQVKTGNGPVLRKRPLPSEKASPTSSLPYLNGGTPRTLQRLQEEHRKRTGSDKVISLQEPTVSSPCNKPKVTPFKSKRTARLKLRSITLQRLPLSGTKKSSSGDSSDTEAATSQPASTNSGEGTLSGNSFLLRYDTASSEGDSSPSQPPKCTAFIQGFNAGKPLSKLVSNSAKSFIPTRNTTKQIESKEVQQAKLKEKVKKKEEEEARRKEELEEKRMQEIQLKKQKREERARRVAEKQAALKIEQEERRKRNAGEDHAERVEQQKQMRLMRLESKNRKLKERMLAAEARRKKDEETLKKKLQQLEDEKKMCAELAARRREAEEEEKRQRKLDKQRQERERQLQHEAELREKEEGRKKRLEEEESHKREPLAKKGRNCAQYHNTRGTNLQKCLGDLLLSGSSKVPPPLISQGTVQATPHVQPLNHTSNKFLQGFYKAVVGSIIPPANIASATEVTTEDPPPVAKPDFNTTFIKDTTDTQVVATTTPLSKSASVDEYEMTPMESDPIIVCDNYNIQDLSSDDSTDDEDCPKKAIPNWAKADSLETVILSQEEAIHKENIDINKIFPPEQLLKDCDLNKIFKFKRKRFFQRSSSAQWNSPFPGSH